MLQRSKYRHGIKNGKCQQHQKLANKIVTMENNPRGNKGTEVKPYYNVSLHRNEKQKQKQKFKSEIQFLSVACACNSLAIVKKLFNVMQLNNKR